MHFAVHALCTTLIVLVALIVTFIIVRRVVVSILRRKVLTAIVTCVLTFIYWIFAPDVVLDPALVGHIVTAILFLGSAGKIHQSFTRQRLISDGDTK